MCVLVCEIGFLGNLQYQALVWSMLARSGVFAASAVTWIHTPELFPTRVRATAHAVANSSAQLGSFCAPFLLSAGGPGVVGCVLAGLSAMAMFCVLPLPETSGTCLSDADVLSLNTIDKNMDRKVEAVVASDTINPLRPSASTPLTNTAY